LIILNRVIKAYNLGHSPKRTASIIGKENRV